MVSKLFFPFDQRVNEKIYFTELLPARTRIKKSKHTGFLCIFAFALRCILLFICHYPFYIFSSPANRWIDVLREVARFLRPDLQYIFKDHEAIA